MNTDKQASEPQTLRWIKWWLKDLAKNSNKQTEQIKFDNYIRSTTTRNSK